MNSPAATFNTSMAIKYVGLRQYAMKLRIRSVSTWYAHAVAKSESEWWIAATAPR